MRTSLTVALVFSAACTDASGPDAVEVAHDPLIYGVDDRRDYYELTDPGQLTIADATAAVVWEADLSASGGGYELYVGTSFAAEYGLCSGEPYRTQPTSAWCTAFKVGPDLVATAGHCISTTSECNAVAFVFGFQMESATVVRSSFAADDVYACTAIVARAETSTDDWALIRVDRPIVARPTLPIRRFGKVDNQAPLVLAGHPAGIPLKVAANATVRSNTATNYFEANVDAYGGNSGSPVVNGATGVVEGVLVRGNADFVWDRRARCYRSNVCSDAGCPGWEDASRTTRFAALVPCAGDAECDDGDVCNGAEACVGASCVAGAPVDCNDGDLCTSDACTDVDGVATCSNAALSCNDGNACTTDACDPEVGCASTPIVCEGGQSCVGGTCVSCQPINAFCTAHSQCCSGSCNTKKKKCR